MNVVGQNKANYTQCSLHKVLTTFLIYEENIPQTKSKLSRSNVWKVLYTKLHFDLQN